MRLTFVFRNGIFEEDVVQDLLSSFSNVRMGLPPVGGVQGVVIGETGLENDVRKGGGDV